MSSKCAVCGKKMKRSDIMVCCGAGTYIGRCCPGWTFNVDHEPVRLGLLPEPPKGEHMNETATRILEAVRDDQNEREGGRGF